MHLNPSDTENRIEESHHGSGVDDQSRESSRIIMIDDEPLILELYEVFLSRAGFTSLHSFSDSIEAIETLKFVTPDLILTDLQMPEVSGNFLVKLIRTYSHLKHVPIVAITSETSDDVRERIMRMGANAVAHKPMDAEKLVEIVSLALRAGDELKQHLTTAEKRKQEIQSRRKANVISAENSLRGMVR